MKRPGSATLLKCLLLLVAGGWHAWFEGGLSVGILWGLLPYYLLVLAWDYIRRWFVLIPVLALLVLSDVRIGLGFRHSTSSTGAVALGMQVIFGCIVVSAAVVLTFFISRVRVRRSSSRDAG